MAKDKIIQITGVSTKTVILTQSGRILERDNKGNWLDISPPKNMLNIEDIPRFWFGRHKGESIVDADPTYIEWCNNNIDGFNYRVEDGKLITEEEIPF